ncbi:MAG: flippase-like domain-containing protein [Chloroflexi bacterium]|nr:flippase-like domain-containing protein [Chloroflexota bacterium]
MGRTSSSFPPTPPSGWPRPSPGWPAMPGCAAAWVRAPPDWPRISPGIGSLRRQKRFMRRSSRKASLAPERNTQYATRSYFVLRIPSSVRCWERWMGKEKLLNLLKVCFSLALLALLLRQIGWQQTLETLGKARFSYLAAALALYLVGIVVRAYRWQILLNALGMDTPLARLTVLYFVGTFFSSFLPTGIGGDVVRVYELSRQSKRPIESVGTVLLDRVTGLLMLFLIALMALAFSYQLIAPNVSAAILLLCLGSWAGLGLMLRRDWLERWGLLRIMAKIKQIRELYESITACGLKAIGGALAISLVFNVLLIAVNYLIALSLRVEIPLWYFLLFIPLISFLLILPISLSGLGVREGGYVYLFAQAGVSAPLALAMSLLFYVLNVASGLIGGVLYAFEGVRGYVEDRG